jgi:hypothetical protein
MNIHSFIITITFKEKPVILRFIGGPGEVGDAYEVSALNDGEFPTFFIYRRPDGWLMDTDVPDELRVLEPRLSAMANAYTEGQQIM